MKRTILSIFGGFALISGTPLCAQVDAGVDDDMAELDSIMAGMTALFPREPLTPEQEARLPAAERIITLMIPQGAMGEIMGGLIDDIFQPMIAMGPSPSTQTIADGIGVAPTELALDEETSDELAGLFDTAYRERRDRQFAVLPEVLREMMTAMEPGLRTVMTELYAIKFDERELADIERFFSTETGAKYARESFAMSSDPRIMSASMEALPAMMGALGDMEARILEATADLPPVRSYEELTAQERNLITKATGLNEKEIRANLKAAAEAEASEEM